MPDSVSQLSRTAIAVLEMIAAGCTYEQILSAYPELSYLHIFRAAQEALNLAASSSGTPRPAYTVAEKRERYPRAYEQWTDSEDARLRTLVQAGNTIGHIAGQLQRNWGAIRSRVQKLGLVNDLTPQEQARMGRIVARESLGKPVE
jgi:hypothetical protein